MKTFVTGRLRWLRTAGFREMRPVFRLRRRWPPAQNSPLIVADYANLVATLRPLESLLVSPAAGMDAPPPAVVMRIALDLSIRINQTFTAMFGETIGGIVFSAIILANIRHLLTRPALSAQFGRHDAPPPDALRTPVSIRTIAREMLLPRETVRRQFAALRADGMVVDVGRKGVIVPAAVLVAERFQRNNRMILAQFERMSVDLGSIGFVLPKLGDVEITPTVEYSSDAAVLPSL